MEKWADYLISAVRYEADGSGIDQLRVHEYNGDKVGSAHTWDRKSVVHHIEDHGDSFCTIRKNSDSKWSRGDDVHVIHVGGVKYVRTDGNKTAADNLGSLPEF